MAHYAYSNEPVQKNSLFKSALQLGAVAAGGYGAYKGVNYLHGINKGASNVLSGPLAGGMTGNGIKGQVLKEKILSDISGIGKAVGNTKDHFSGGAKEGFTKLWDDVKNNTKAWSPEEYKQKAKEAAERQTAKQPENLAKKIEQDLIKDNLNSVIEPNSAQHITNAANGTTKPSNTEYFSKNIKTPKVNEGVLNATEGNAFKVHPASKAGLNKTKYTVKGGQKALDAALNAGPTSWLSPASKAGASKGRYTVKGGQEALNKAMGSKPTLKLGKILKNVI